MTSFLENLGKNIKFYRKAKKLSQVELAKILNVSDVAISTWEKGKADPSSTNIVALANAFETSTDELLNHNSTFNTSVFLEKNFSNTKLIEDNEKIIITLKK